MLLLRRRLRLGGGLLALGVVALFAVRPPPVRGDRGGSQHNLESHQYKDSRKCLLTAVAALGCAGKRTSSPIVVKRHADKRQHGGGGGGGKSGGGGGDNDLDRNNNFDYNYYDGGGGGTGGGRYGVDDGQDGGGGGAAAENGEEYFDQPLITDPRDRMLPVIYNPRPMYAPPPPLPLPHHQQQQQHPSPPYNRYDEDAPHSRLSQFEVPIIGECVVYARNVPTR